LSPIAWGYLTCTSSTGNIEIVLGKYSREVQTEITVVK